MDFSYSTNRLLIKILTPDYGPEVLKFLSDNKSDFEPYELTKPDNYYTVSYQKNNLKTEYKLFTKMKYIRFYVFKKENTNEIIGTISLSNIFPFPYSCATIGYKFDKNHRKNGYASEAICCIINALFRESFIRRIEAYVMPRNTASIHLLERIGFTNEGLCHKYVSINGIYEDHYRYSIIKE